jgi:6-pyruvoyltetrahydropterin/6-carboxytetrahydropterin synthase
MDAVEPSDSQVDRGSIVRYYSTKTYGNEQGLSCCFRQWKADSHCSKLHGYAIGVRFTFECDRLDDRSWVVDFGGLKEVKDFLSSMFDHTVLVARDDPSLPYFSEMESSGLLDLRIVDSVGCESFARLIYDRVSVLIAENYELNRSARLYSVEVFEHGSNSAIYRYR